MAVILLRFSNHNSTKLTLTKCSFLVFTFGILFISCKPIKITGKYQTNFGTYGMFGKTLTISCDSTFVLNFRGDLMNDNSLGKWKINGDTLILTYDTINYPKSRYKGVDKYLVKPNKLTNYFPISKDKYKELVALIEKEGMTDSLKIGSYSKFKRTAGKTFANFQGKMKRQYFMRVETAQCGR